MPSQFNNPAGSQQSSVSWCIEVAARSGGTARSRAAPSREHLGDTAGGHHKHSRAGIESMASKERHWKTYPQPRAPPLVNKRKPYGLGKRALEKHTPCSCVVCKKYTPSVNGTGASRLPWCTQSWPQGPGTSGRCPVLTRHTPGVLRCAEMPADTSVPSKALPTLPTLHTPPVRMPWSLFPPG